MLKINIESEGTGARTRIWDADTGEIIPYVRSIVIYIEARSQGVWADLAVYETERYEDESGLVRQRVVLDPHTGKPTLCLRPALLHHYANNDHHPEYHADLESGHNPLQFMNLLQIMEMLADWWASTERVKDGDILKSIEANRHRFQMGDLLSQILVNTVVYLREKKAAFVRSLKETKTS